MTKNIYILSILFVFSFSHAQYQQDFSAGIPPSWSMYNTGPVSSVNWTTYEGAAFAGRENIGQDSLSETWLTTQTFTEYPVGLLSFDVKKSIDGNQLSWIRIMIGSPNNWHTVTEFSDDELTTNYVRTTILLDGRTYPLGYKIAFMRIFRQPEVTIGGNSYFIDNINLQCPCWSPQNLHVSSNATTPWSAKLGWTFFPTGACGTPQFEVQVAPSGSPLGTTGVVVTGSSYEVRELNPNTSYQFYVRTNCTDGQFSEWVGPYNFMTSQASSLSCSENFYDSGGAAGNYQNYQGVSTVICAEAQDSTVRMNFVSFSLEDNHDFLKIYDGANNSAPLIGSFTGTALPTNIQSTNPDGCLTFVFTSDITGSAAGWQATSQCTLGLTQNQITDFTYTPNPTKEIVTISAKEMLNTITVYDMLGRQLLEYHPSAMQTRINLLTYPAGVYLFKVNAHGKEKTFKIQKL